MRKSSRAGSATLYTLKYIAIDGHGGAARGRHSTRNFAKKTARYLDTRREGQFA